jgi:hypothetical protein
MSRVGGFYKPYSREMEKVSTTDERSDASAGSDYRLEGFSYFRYPQLPP